MYSEGSRCINHFHAQDRAERFSLSGRTQERQQKAHNHDHASGTHFVKLAYANIDRFFNHLFLKAAEAGGIPSTILIPSLGNSNHEALVLQKDVLGSF